MKNDKHTHTHTQRGLGREGRKKGTSRESKHITHNISSIGRTGKKETNHWMSWSKISSSSAGGREENKTKRENDENSHLRISSCMCINRIHVIWLACFVPYCQLNLSMMFENEEADRGKVVEETQS